jgi:hypothetical protein
MGYKGLQGDTRFRIEIENAIGQALYFWRGNCVSPCSLAVARRNAGHRYSGWILSLLFLSTIIRLPLLI